MRIKLEDGWIIDFDDKNDKIIGTQLYTKQIDEDGIVDWICLGEIVEVMKL